MTHDDDLGLDLRAEPGTRTSGGRWPRLVVLFLLGACVWAVLFLRPFQVPQNGMYPGAPAGSLLLVRTLTDIGRGRLAAGDVVCFRRMHEDGEEYVYVWRVVAVGGERVDVAERTLSIDGEPVARDRLRQERAFDAFNGTMAEYDLYVETLGGTRYTVAYDEALADRAAVSLIVPDGAVFVMGDNRDHAVDSRTFGAVPLEDVFGVVMGSLDPPA